MKSLLEIIFIFSLFYVIFRAFGRKKVRSEDDSEPEPFLHQTNCNFTIDDISEQLSTVNDVMQQIKNVEELITDIEICEPGRNLSFQFWVHGGDELKTDLMLKLSYSERRGLHSLLKKEIRNLGERSYINGTDTMTNNDIGVICND